MEIQCGPDDLNTNENEEHKELVVATDYQKNECPSFVIEID